MRSHSRSPGPSRAPRRDPAADRRRRADGPGACSPAFGCAPPWPPAARRDPGCRVGSPAGRLSRQRAAGWAPFPFLRFSPAPAGRSAPAPWEDVAAGLVLRPVANLGKPALVVLAGVTADLPLGLAADPSVCASHPAFTAPMRAMATLRRAARVSSPPPGGSPARRCRASSPISRSRAAGLGQSLRTARARG